MHIVYITIWIINKAKQQHNNEQQNMRNIHLFSLSDGYIVICEEIAIFSAIFCFSLYCCLNLLIRVKSETKNQTRKNKSITTLRYRRSTNKHVENDLLIHKSTGQIENLALLL